MLSITIEGLTNLIKKLDIQKASGPDKIFLYSYIKKISKNVPKYLSCLTLVMQASLDHNDMYNKTRKQPMLYNPHI